MRQYTRPLLDKLGIKPGMTLYIHQPPPAYREALAYAAYHFTTEPPLSPCVDFIHFFTTKREELIANFPRLAKAVYPNGMLWVSWPKQQSKESTDLNENVVREVGLNHRMVDVKVVAIDEVWSGLKFVYRRNDRKEVHG